MPTKKHIVTILGLLLTIGTANSQRIADTNRIWSNLVYDYWHYPQHSTHYTRIGNDTTVNDTLFHFVLRSDDEQKESWYRIGYLREDSINRVFFRNALTSNEILILDFNVGINDTILISSLDTYHHKFEVYVDSIDTITVEDKERKRFFLFTEMAGHITETWIEGIGSLSGFPYNYFGLVGGDSYFLLCAHISDTLIYQKSEFSKCWESTVNIDKLIYTSTLFTIAPNPIENVSILSYRGKYSNDILIEFKSINGNLIYQQVMKPNENIEINREDFEPGLYIVTLKSSKLIESIKVIVL